MLQANFLPWFKTTPYIALLSGWQARKLTIWQGLWVRCEGGNDDRQPSRYLGPHSFLSYYEIITLSSFPFIFLRLSEIRCTKICNGYTLLATGSFCTFTKYFLHSLNSWKYRIRLTVSLQKYLCCIPTILLIEDFLSTSAKWVSIHIQELSSCLDFSTFIIIRILIPYHSTFKCNRI